MKAELLALADRVEALTEADREVDAMIGVAVDALHDSTFSLRYLHQVGNSYADIGRHTACPAYTASLDAAMPLVPKGWEWGCGMKDATGRPWAWVGQPVKRRADWDPMATSNSTTPALALTAACLRARAHMEEE